MKHMFCSTPEQAPSLPGAYLLLVEIGKPLTVKFAGKAARTLDASRFLYCSSNVSLNLSGRSWPQMKRSRLVEYSLSLLGPNRSKVLVGGMCRSWSVITMARGFPTRTQFSWPAWPY